MPRSCDRVWRAASAACAGRVPTILQRHPDTSSFGQRLTADEVCPGDRQHSAAADPWRLAPSLRPDLISDTDSGRREHGEHTEPTSSFVSAFRGEPADEAYRLSRAGQPRNLKHPLAHV